MYLLKKICNVARTLMIAIIATGICAAAFASPLAGFQARQPASNAETAINQVKLNQAYDPTVKYAISCQLIMFERSLFAIHVTELSTFKINACDPDLFIATTSASVKAQLNTFTKVERIIQVGPSVQMMDRNTSNVSNPYLSIGLLNFSQVGEGRVTLVDLIQNFKVWMKWRSSSIYNPLNVSENTNYVWLPGSTVYTLTSNTGEVFVMTYFLPSSLSITTEQIETEATNLAGYLNLPTGWKYEAVQLKKVLAVKRQSALGYTSRRLADEYNNSYIGISESIH